MLTGFGRPRSHRPELPMADGRASRAIRGSREAERQRSRGTSATRLSTTADLTNFSRPVGRVSAPRMICTCSGSIPAPEGRV